MRDGYGLGDFEQLVLLAVLKLGDDAYAAHIRETIVAAADRSVSRGALYATLDRLESKGLLMWHGVAALPGRSVATRRRFTVTAEGLSALRRSYGAVRSLARGLERLLGRA